MSPSNRSTAEHFAGALLPAYRLERELGVGGTATVYLAADVKHDRRVAIKIMRRDLLATVGADRFVREIRLAARLTHPNIVPLLDSGQAAGSPYYVMPYIDGESVRARVQRDGRIPIAEAVALATEVADALAYAHAANIVHRDIKPENILLLRGHAVVADFGIARALDQAVGDHHTSVGLVLGTPAYMSPEQAAGDGELDGRSDIYSLATVLFEMINGAPPYTASTVQGLITKRFTEVAPRLSLGRSGIPAHLDDAVAAALSRDPKERPTSAFSFARAITGAPDDGTGALATGMYPTSGLLRPSGTPSNPTLPSVAVLPFANLSTDPENEFFSDGITEEIMSTLSRMRTIRVAARASSFAFKGKRGDVREIAEQLGVGHVLDGSVRRSGTRVRVSAQLVDASSGFQVWSDRLDRNLDDAFAIQDEIAGAIASALSATLLDDAGAVTREGVAGAAYELYLRGRFALNKRTEQDLQAAARFFADAVAQQTGLAVAHSGLADAQLLLGVYGAEAPAIAMPRARDAAQQALAIDPALGEAYATLGSVRALHDWDWAGADDAFRRAIALSPRYPTAWQWRAMNQLIPQGRLDEARSSIDRARALDPLSMVISTSVGVVYHLAGDTAGAVRVLQRAIEHDSGFAIGHYFLGGALRDADQLAEAETAFRTAIEKSSGSPEMTAGLAQVLARQGDTKGARALQRELVTDAGARHVSSCLLAQVHTALGELDEAEAALARAAEARDAELAFIGVRQAYRPLRGRPAFDALRRRVGV